MTKLILGCGYLGSRVARLWRGAGDEIVIVTRDTKRAAEFERDGYTAIVADISQPATLSNLPASDTVLFAVGYDRSPGQTIHHVYEGGLRNVLAALPPSTKRFIYISTTGVYGNAAGEYVDESTPPDPCRDGGRAALAAENALTTHPLGYKSVILRLAGLYGPGRVPFLELLRAGKPIPAAEHGHLNLIHVDDAAAVVVAVGQITALRNGLRVYCVSDGNPVQRGEYFREVARQIGAPTPRFAAPEAGSPRAARAESDRRIRNDRMRSELDVELMYPDYRAGLAAILSAFSF
jgi:nucleoside-diphosphate-sugar epimerase